MPCAAGELCQLPDRTPEAPDGHQCHGGCGGRLHGLCGEQDQDAEFESARICYACIASKQKQKASDASTAGNDEASEEPSSYTAPPPYAALSSHFGALEAAAEGSGNHDAAFHIQKAKMAMIAAHGSKATRQTDMRQFL